MFKIETEDGERYMVQLIGPHSYRYGEMQVFRGQTLTVTEKSRKYLLKTGFFRDFDPTPPEPVEEVVPPQFGGPTGPQLDPSDFDVSRTRPMTLQESLSVAETSDLASAKVGGKPTLADNSGDLTSADLKAPKPAGGSTAAKSKATGKKTGVNIEHADAEEAEVVELT